MSDQTDRRTDEQTETTNQADRVNNYVEMRTGEEWDGQEGIRLFGMGRKILTFIDITNEHKFTYTDGCPNFNNYRTPENYLEYLPIKINYEEDKEPPIFINKDKNGNDLTHKDLINIPKYEYAYSYKLKKYIKITNINNEEVLIEDKNNFNKNNKPNGEIECNIYDGCCGEMINGEWVENLLTADVIYKSPCGCSQVICFHCLYKFINSSLFKGNCSQCKKPNYLENYKITKEKIITKKWYDRYTLEDLKIYNYENNLLKAFDRNQLWVKGLKGNYKIYDDITEYMTDYMNTIDEDDLRFITTKYIYEDDKNNLEIIQPINLDKNTSFNIIYRDGEEYKALQVEARTREYLLNNIINKINNHNYICNLDRYEIYSRFLKDDFKKIHNEDGLGFADENDFIFRHLTKGLYDDDEDIQEETFKFLSNNFFRDIHDVAEEYLILIETNKIEILDFCDNNYYDVLFNVDEESNTINYYKDIPYLFIKNKGELFGITRLNEL